MKIYTKTGDKGFTGLIGGTRVPKHHIRIESYGTVDELNAWIGLIRDQQIGAAHGEVLRQVQNSLFTVGALLAADPQKSKMELPKITPADIELLEKQIDQMDVELPELRHFILPGGNNAISYCHIARCVCRRAERVVVQLAEESTVGAEVIVYLNRLSDYLFTLARKIGFEDNVAENMWKPGV